MLLSTEIIRRVRGKSSFFFTLNGWINRQCGWCNVVCSREEDMQFCKPLPFCTAGKEIFHLNDLFMKTQEIRWQRCSSLCNNGDVALLGAFSGALACMKKKEKWEYFEYPLLSPSSRTSQKVNVTRFKANADD